MPSENQIRAAAIRDEYIGKTIRLRQRLIEALANADYTEASRITRVYHHCGRMARLFDTENKKEATQ